MTETDTGKPTAKQIVIGLRQAAEVAKAEGSTSHVIAGLLIASDYIEQQAERIEELEEALCRARFLINGGSYGDDRTSLDIIGQALKETP